MGPDCQGVILNAEDLALVTMIVDYSRTFPKHVLICSGHGSNVRGIELEATWDQNTKEFNLHSPTLTASKWWNGTLGRTATHAVVVAQLLLPSGQDGKLVSHGPHPFVVQIRDPATHLPPSSIAVGDIGPKYGYVWHHARSW